MRWCCNEIRVRERAQGNVKLNGMLLGNVDDDDDGKQKKKSFGSEWYKWVRTHNKTYTHDTVPRSDSGDAREARVNMKSEI